MTEVLIRLITSMYPKMFRCIKRQKFVFSKTSLQLPECLSAYDEWFLPFILEHDVLSSYLYTHVNVAKCEGANYKHNTYKLWNYFYVATWTCQQSITQFTEIKHPSKLCRIIHFVRLIQGKFIRYVEFKRYVVLNKKYSSFNSFIIVVTMNVHGQMLMNSDRF